jgi:MFS family permease
MPQDAKPTTSERWYWSMLPYSIVMGMMTPLILVYLMDVIGGGVLESSWAVLAMAIGSVPGAVLWGYLSDRLQRRKEILIIGFVGSGITTLCMYLTRSLEPYLLLIVIFGFLSNAAAPVGPTLVIESTKKEHWAEHLGKFNAICSAGHLTGTLTGFLWLLMFPEGLAWLFILCFFLGLLSARLAQSWITEPKEKMKEMPHFAHHQHVWIIERLRFVPASLFHTPHVFQHMRDIKIHVNKRVIGFTLAVFLAFLGFTAFYAILPAFMVLDAKIDSSFVFLVFMAQSLASLIVHIPVGKWIDRHGYRIPIAGSTFGRAVLFAVGFPFAPLLVGFGFSAFLAFFGLNFISGILWSLFSIASVAAMSALVPREGRSSALGVYTSMQGLGTLIGSLVMGFIASGFGYAVAFAAIGVVIVSGGILGLSTLSSAPSPAQDEQGS